MSTPPSKAKSRIIKPNYLLQAKVGRMELTKDVVRKSKEAFENHNIDYSPYAKETLNALEESISRLRQSPDQRDTFEEDIIARIMQIKANAPQFNYPLMGRLANIMLEFLEKLNTIDKHALEILEAHITTLKTILQQKIQGSNHGVGDKLETELRAACTRYFSSKEKLRN